MTKKELIHWLDEKKHHTISEKQEENRLKKNAMLKEQLEPRGFYEMAEQVESCLEQAWNLWETWKENEGKDLVENGPRYQSFDSQMKTLLGSCIPLDEHMMKYDIQLCSESLEKLNESRGLVSKICVSYDKVISNVTAAQNTKEAINYVRGLGFDLSELEKPESVDTEFLFVKQAA